MKCSQIVWVNLPAPFLLRPCYPASRRRRLPRGLLPPPPATWCRFRCRLSSVHCLAHGDLGEHQRTLALYCFQQHLSRDLPLRPLMYRFRQLLNVFAGILRGAEHAAIRAGGSEHGRCATRVSAIAHDAHGLLVPIKIRPYVRAALAAGLADKARFDFGEWLQR